MGKKKRRILLVDGDIIVYQQACLNQHDIKWRNGAETCVLTSDKAIQACDDYLAYMMKQLKGDWLYVCFGTRENFRKKLFPEYKANRKNVNRPKLRYELPEYIEKNYKTIKRPTLEGDDVLGIFQTGPFFEDMGETLIVTIDKDLMQIPGKHFNPMKAKQGVREVKEDEADYRFYTQVLTGDPTDNYKGIPGVGPAKAKKILAEAAETGDPADYWKAIVEAYEAKDLTEEDAIMQARMARILRWEDWNEDKQEVRLWEPL